MKILYDLSHVLGWVWFDDSGAEFFLPFCREEGEAEVDSEGEEVENSKAVLHCPAALGCRRLIGQVVWFSLRVWEVSDSIPESPLFSAEIVNHSIIW
jgi:hypothetical protein